MTAIPEPTREDFENLQKLEAWHSACAVRMSGKVVADSWQESLGSAVRLLSHYQRENERLARQRDVLEKACREHAADYVSFMKIIAANHPDTTESASTEWEVAKEFIDALSGEGGAA